MKTNKLLIFISFLLLLSCEQPQPWPNQLEPCSDIQYYQFSDPGYDRIYMSFKPHSVVGPFFFDAERYEYSDPTFNPHNPMEFAYARADTQFWGLDGEIWTYNFCDGRSRKIADNLYYNLDWGANGWLLYTGTGHQIFKIKANGDSLTQLTNKSGYNRAGKWNPSGELFFNDRDFSTEILNENGQVLNSILTQPFGPIDWINDSTILGWRDQNFYSLNINSEKITSLNTSPTCASCPYIFNPEANCCYVSMRFGPQKGLLRYSLDGSNTVDTVAKMYPSYMYELGDYHSKTQKFLIGLDRQAWRDSLKDQRWTWSNIILMNSDGSGERMVNLE
ncbi:MAG: hypothetical protein H6581_06240 [Bacteroidia bacterium]|nr:hypothetical protein [Bacteroidia bacterium]